MRTIFSIAIIILSFNLWSQDYEPYNRDMKFAVINGDDELADNKNIEAIIVLFNISKVENLRIAILNNPQLKEIKLFNPNQEFIEFISEAKLPSLTHLLIEDYNHAELDLPKFQNIEHLMIQSKSLITLSMLKCSFLELEILDMKTPLLEKWSTYKQIPKLGLIDLTAPKLDYFPILSMPEITQFSYYCSFKNLPLGLCNYKNLLYISFENYGQIEVEKCFQKKVRKGVYSNITVLDKIDGSIIFEVLSKDRKE